MAGGVITSYFQGTSQVGPYRCAELRLAFWLQLIIFNYMSNDDFIG